MNILLANKIVQDDNNNHKEEKWMIHRASCLSMFGNNPKYI